jgi:hypothetical protein
MEGKLKFKAGDKVVRTVGPDQDETACLIGEVATVECWLPTYGGVFVVRNSRTNGTLH